MRRFSHSFITFLSLMPIFACGTQTNGHFAPEALENLGRECPATGVVVQVLDGFMSLPCGCDEGDSGAVASSQPLTCTFPQASPVIVQYGAARLNHHLVRTDFQQATAPYLPRSDGMNVSPVSALSFSTPGTYVFRDLQVPGSQLTLIAR